MCLYLEKENKNVWQLKTSTVPVIVGVLLMINKCADKHINNLPDSPRLYKIQKVELGGTAHLINVIEKYYPKELAKK